MSTLPHPAAPDRVPFFLPGPDGSDPVLVGTGIFLLLATLAFGLLFLRLHTLPERIAHRSHKLQFEIVAVLGLLSLFTGTHAFWVAGLLLAFLDIPDFTGPMRRIAGSAERLAGLPPGAGDTSTEDKPHALQAVEEPSRAEDAAHKRPRARHLVDNRL